MKLVRMLTRPCLLRPTDLVIAGHAHFLGVVTAGVMRAAQHLVLAIILVFFLSLLFLVDRRVVVLVRILCYWCGLIVMMKLH